MNNSGNSFLTFSKSSLFSEGKNIILIDELVSSGKTMNEAYNYLQNIKNVNDIYTVSVALEKNRYTKDLYIDNVINGVVLIWPWGYDN